MWWEPAWQQSQGASFNSVLHLCMLFMYPLRSAGDGSAHVAFCAHMQVQDSFPAAWCWRLLLLTLFTSGDCEHFPRVAVLSAGGAPDAMGNQHDIAAEDGEDHGDLQIDLLQWDVVPIEC